MTPVEERYHIAQTLHHLKECQQRATHRAEMRAIYNARIELMARYVILGEDNA